MIYAKDADHRYLLANRELEVHLGLPAGDAVGRADDELLGEAQAAERRSRRPEGARRRAARSRPRRP